MAACPSSQLPRRSHVTLHLMRHDLNASSNFPTNAITTSKYTIVTFLPLNLLEQFRRVSNMYFLIVMICTLIPGATSINPYSAVIPFMFVLAVAAVKDGLEDFKRHKADHEANAKPVHVLRDGEFVEMPSKDIQVGDVVKFRFGEEIRVDGLILNSALPDGLAYIETANLDGETNAKTRRAKPITVEELGTIEQISRRCGHRSHTHHIWQRRQSLEENIATHPLPENAASASHHSSILEAHSRPNRHLEDEERFSTPLELPHNRPHTAAGQPSGPTAQHQIAQPLSGASSAGHGVGAPPPTRPRSTSTEGMWSEAGGAESRTTGDRESNLSDPNVSTPVRTASHRVQAAPSSSPPPAASSLPGPSTAAAAPQSSNALPMAAAAAHTSPHHRVGSGQYDLSNGTGVQVVCAEPNPNLALWHGKLHMPDGSVHPLSIDQFVPRGCVLRNTEWVICTALYTGNESKMMLNLRERPMKQSVMEQKVNRMNVFLFSVNQAVILLFCGLGVRFRMMNMLEDGDPTSADAHHGMWYVRYRMEEYPMIAMYFWRYLNLFALVSYLIPLSLYVSLEFVKATQIAYIAKDDQMAIQMPNGEFRYPRPKTSNLNVQLAHVRYIFTDKTGTLTENMMNFVGGYVGGKVFSSLAIPGGLGLELVETVHPSQPRQPDDTSASSQQHATASVAAQPAAPASSATHAHPTGKDGETKPLPSLVVIPGTNSDSSQSTREPTSATMIGNIGPNSSTSTQVPQGLPGSAAARSSASPFTEATAFPQQQQQQSPQPPPQSNQAAGPSSATAPHLLDTVHDLDKTVLSVIQDEKGTVLLPPDICMQFVEAEVSKLAAYRYLLTLSLCHNVVCFDPTPAAPKSHPPSGQTSAAASRAASFRKSVLKRKSHHRTVSVVSGVHNRTTSAATSINPNNTMSRAHSRTFSGVGLAVSHHVSPASPSNFGAHNRILSGGAIHSRGPSILPSDLGSMRHHGLNHPSHGSMRMGAHLRTISRGGSQLFHGSQLGSAPPPLAPVYKANTKQKEKIYEGQSLDEVALVKAARDNGFQLVHRSVRQIVVDIFGVPVVYEIIAELEFTPQRKLMSIILKRDKNADASFHQNCRSYFPQPSHLVEGHHSRVASFESLSGSGTYQSAATTSAATKKQQRRRVMMASFDDGQGPQPPSLIGSTMLPNRISSPDVGNRVAERSFSGDISMTGASGLAEFPKIQFDQNTIGGGGRPGDTTTPDVALQALQNGKLYQFKGIQQPYGQHTATVSTDLTTNTDVGSAPYGRASSVSHSPTRRDPFSLGAQEFHAVAGGRGPAGGAISGYSESPASTTASAAPFSNDDEYLMLTKGADSSMFAALDQTSMYNKLQKPECTIALSEMASTGLRTLVLGYRNLTQEDIDKWLPTFQAAQTNEDNRDDALHEAYAQIEHSLTIIGTTAVEDKLQDGVPETLQFLLDAEIVIWMLTGDKRETAVTIAATSGLMDPTADICMHVDVTHMPMDTDAELDAATDEVVKQLDRVKAECDKALEGNANPAQVGSTGSATSRVVLVIDGQSLNLILRSPERTAVFFHVGARCRSAVCCRMTPLQKADIVKLFQENTQGVALAIGDGANDVTMIQESRIGIGIMGLEGSQAELASDFAIPKFRHLKRLLCVHGRNALYRESQCILFSVYKNLVLTCTLATFCYYTAYTGVAMMDSWTLAMWNVFFVSVPPLLLGIIDKDIDDELAETHPQLYPPLAREDMYMNVRAMLTWLVDGLVHGFFVFLLIMVPIGREALHKFHSLPLEVGGLTIYIVLVFLTNLQAVSALQMTNVFNVGGMMLSFAGILAFTLAQASLSNLGGVTEMYYVAFDVYSSDYFWIYMAFFNIGLLSVWNMTRSYLMRDWLPVNNTMMAKIAGQRAWEIAKKKWAENEKAERERELAQQAAAAATAQRRQDEQHDAREWSSTH